MNNNNLPPKVLSTLSNLLTSHPPTTSLHLDLSSNSLPSLPSLTSTLLRPLLSLPLSLSLTLSSNPSLFPPTRPPPRPLNSTTSCCTFTHLDLASTSHPLNFLLHLPPSTYNATLLRLTLSRCTLPPPHLAKFL
ncbi:hypothetical protein TrRE_jg5337, partial [Triparma retinervis]